MVFGVPSSNLVEKSKVQMIVNKEITDQKKKISRIAIRRDEMKAVLKKTYIDWLQSIY